VARFRRRTFRGRRSPTRSREWLGHAIVDPSTGSPATAVALDGSLGAAIWGGYLVDPDTMTTIFDEPTLVRSIIHWQQNQIQPALADSGYFLALGLIALKSEQMSSPFTAAELNTVPWPYWDADSDWIWHQMYAYTNQTSVRSYASAVMPGVGEADIRTKRKFPNGTGLALIMYYEATPDTADTWVTFNARTLWLNR